MDGAGFLKRHRDRILELAAQFGANNVRVFGSWATGDAHADSDVDLLVDLDPDRSLLDQVGLLQALEELLGRRVDLVVDGGVSPYLREQILAGARPL